MDPGMNDPNRTRTTRRVVLTKPHRTQRAPGDQAVVWRRRRRSFGTSAGVWLVLAVAGAIMGWGVTLVALAIAAGVLSAAGLVTAQVLVSRAGGALPR